MVDQAERLRRLVMDAAPSVRDVGELPPTIVVSGGKGGVGTSTVAINLAAALVEQGRRTLLLDAAPNADIAQLLGVEVERGRSLEDLLAGGVSATEILHDGPAGISLLAGHWAADHAPDRSPKSLDRLLEQLPSLDGVADAVIIDGGCGLTNWTRRLWQLAEMVLVVTTPDDVAVMDTYATIKRGLPAQENIDLRVLVNACQDTATAADVQSRLAASCRRFLGRVIGRAPLVSRHIGELSAGNATPLAWQAPSSPFARNIHQLGRFAADVLAHHKRADRQKREFSTC